MLKRALELLITNTTSPLPFYTYLICPQGINYFALRAVGVILKDIISGPFNYVEQKGYLEIFIGCVWRNGGLGRGVSCPPITFDYLKGHSLFQFPTE